MLEYVLRMVKLTKSTSRSSGLTS